MSQETVTSDVPSPLPIKRIGPAPLHEQVATRLREAIANGRWSMHRQLPSEFELCREFEVSRGTIRRALQTLADAGLVVTTHGKGTFVMAHSGVERPIVQEVFSLAEALQRQGVEFSTENRSVGLVSPDEACRRLLSPPEGVPLLRLVRRRSVGGVWVAYLIDYVRTDICPGIETLDLENRLLFEVIENDYGHNLEWGTRTYGAEALNDYVAAELNVPAGSPALYQEQVTYLTDSRPAEYSQVWIRADRLRVSILLHRDRSAPAHPHQAPSDRGAGSGR